MADIAIKYAKKHSTKKIFYLSEKNVLLSIKQKKYYGKTGSR